MENWFEHDGKKVDLSKLTRIYPAVLINAGGEFATVSLEWAEMKADRIEIQSYVLVCDIDPIGEVPVNRVEFHYPDKGELFEAIETVSAQLKR